MAEPIKPGYEVYTEILDVMRIRIQSIERTILEKDTWPPLLLQEYCYLQLRMICEGIAIGCLFAHDAFKHPRSFDEWRAPKIMSTLDQLNPRYFPKGIVVKSVNGSFDISDRTAPQITKEEVSKLWKKSGDILHIGSAKSVLNRRIVQNFVDLAEIQDTAQRILNLMEVHSLSSPE